jgi:hypothetical protein
MKHLIITFLLLAGIAAKSQQITLEKTYTSIAYYARVSESESVYYTFDAPTKTLTVFNAIHTPIKTITADLTDTAYSVGYVSRRLFDTDQDFEFLLFTTKGFYVIDEDGSILFLRLSPGFYANIVNTPEGSKMIMNNISEHTTLVYNLPGTILGKTELSGVKGSPAYPNPATEFIVIPNKTKNAFIKIYSATGSVVEEFTTSSDYMYNISTLPTGQYLYEIDQVYAGKFIKQ